MTGDRPRGVLATLALATVTWLPLQKGLERAAKAVNQPAAVMAVIAYGKDVMLAVLIVAAVFMVLSGALRLRVPYVVTVVSGAMLVLTMLMIALAHGFSLTGLYGIRNYGEPVAGGLAIGALLRRYDRTAQLPAVVAVVALVTLVLGALQFAFPFSPLVSAMRLTDTDQYGDLPPSLSLSIADLFRAVSTLQSPNDFGLYTVLAGLVTTAPSPWLERHPLIRRCTRWGVLVGLGITFSRGAVLCGVVALFVMGAAYVLSRQDRDTRQVWRALRSVAIVLVIVGGAVAVAQDSPQAKLLTATLQGDEESQVAHVESLREGLQRAIENPGGYGLGTVGPRAGKYGYEGKVYQVESAYLQLWLEVGLPGVIVIVFVLMAAGGGTFIDSVTAQTLLRRRETRLAAGMVIGFSAVYFFTPALSDLPTGTLVWSYLGLAMCDPAPPV